MCRAAGIPVDATRNGRSNPLWMSFICRSGASKDGSASFRHPLMYGLALISVLLPLGDAQSRSEEPSKGPQTTRTAPVGVSKALIVVGIPGTQEHEESFATVAKDWKDWLTTSLDFLSSEVRLLFGKHGQQGLAKGPATREARSSI